MACSCKVKGPFKGCLCRAETYGLHFTSDDWCNCSCHTTLDQEMRCSSCHKMNPCRYAPSPDAGPYWRCSECGEIVDIKEEG
jgi:hypothetical protein